MVTYCLEVRIVPEHMETVDRLASREKFVISPSSLNMGSCWYFLQWVGDGFSTQEQMESMARLLRNNSVSQINLITRNTLF